MGQSFFNIENFACGYPGFKLSEIGFSMQKGSFTGIIGPNGSGKTTLFRGITGALPTLSGQVSLKGKHLHDLSLKERAQNIAIVTQFVDTDQISVEDYVLLGRIPYHSRFQFFESKDDFAKAHKYMELTDVFQFKDKLMTELSGGEQQRAAIARALTQEPELLLLDEPTSHLDITHQVKILDLLNRLNQEMGLTVLMVIHDLNLASEYCDHLVLVNHGRIFTQGSPEDVLTFDTLEKVYRTPVVTQTNPYSKKPVVFLVSEKTLRKNSESK